MLPPAKISGTTLVDTIAGDGCIIHAERIENCVVGIRTRIGHGTQIFSCYLMGTDFYETIEDMEFAAAKNLPKMGIGDNCYIKNAIIDKNCRIGNNVTINGGAHLANMDHELYTIKDGIVVVKKGSVLSDGYVID